MNIKWVTQWNLRSNSMPFTACFGPELSPTHCFKFRAVNGNHSLQHLYPNFYTRLLETLLSAACNLLIKSRWRHGSCNCFLTFSPTIYLLAYASTIPCTCIFASAITLALPGKSHRSQLQAIVQGFMGRINLHEAIL